MLARMFQKMTHLWIPLIIAMMFLGQESSAQTPPPLRENYSYSNWREAIAKWQINALYDGVLLVRLKTNQRAIDTLRAVGNTKYADKIESKQRKINDELIAAFQSDFDFCDVYFFNSEHSQLVREHKLDSIPFVAKQVVNPEGEPLSPSTSFLVAELTTLAPDTARRADIKHPEVKRENDETVYYSNSNLGIPVLVFKSDQFVQLDTPFPYYVRTYKSIDFFVERPLTKVVKSSNIRLHEFKNRGMRYTIPEKEIRPPSIHPKWRTSISAGYSIRTSGNVKSFGSQNSAYKDELSQGFALGADMTHFFTNVSGFGINYLYNKFSAKESGTSNRDDISINMLGPQYVARLIGSNTKDALYVNVGFGYSWYKNEFSVTDTDGRAAEAIVKAGSVGLNMGLAYDIDVSKAVAVGIQASIASGKYQENGSDDYLTRFQLLVGVRFK